MQKRFAATRRVLSKFDRIFTVNVYAILEFVVEEDSYFEVNLLHHTISCYHFTNIGKKTATKGEWNCGKYTE